MKKVYEIYGFEREMFIRYATESEKDMEKEKEEKYEAF